MPALFSSQTTICILYLIESQKNSFSTESRQVAVVGWKRPLEKFRRTGSWSIHGSESWVAQACWAEAALMAAGGM